MTIWWYNGVSENGKLNQDFVGNFAFFTDWLASFHFSLLSPHLCLILFILLLLLSFGNMSDGEGYASGLNSHDY